MGTPDGMFTSCMDRAAMGEKYSNQPDIYLEGRSFISSNLYDPFLLHIGMLGYLMKM